MGSTTFGYDQGEDRLWLSFDDGTPRLWFTRRLASHMLGPMLRRFEEAAPGREGGAVASTRVALERELALNELLPGERRLPIKMGAEALNVSRLADYVLCTGLKASFDGAQCRLRFNTDQGRRVLNMDRVTMHRWLHGLHMVVQHADWALDVPEWLARSCLPEAMRALVAPFQTPPASSEEA